MAMHNVAKGIRSTHPLSPSTGVILYSFIASFFVLAVSLLIQWVVYDDWLHHTGPLRIVGTSIAAVVTFLFALRWQGSVSEQRREMMRRLEVILHINDRIRNALQVIECVTYLSQPEATASVRRSVNDIDALLRDLLDDASRPSMRGLPVPTKTSGANTRKSA